MTANIKTKSGSVFFFALFFTLFLTKPAFAAVGDMGFFGGISEGRKLPKTTELLLSQNARARGRDTRPPLSYKELIFLSGRPWEFTGVLDVSANGGVADNADFGTYTETYRVLPSAATDRTVTINRAVTYTVNWRRENSQVVKDYTVRSWVEAISTPDGTYILDPQQSTYSVSVIEDHTPGVTYYRGDVSMHAVYGGGTSADSSGSLYGYSCAWSSTETHRLDVTVSGEGWQARYQIRPSVSVSKTLQYAANEPEAISFAGNYKEVMQNASGLKYDYYVMPWMYPDQDASGGTSLAAQNTFEQLTAPDLSFLAGHPAEDDIKRLFAMQVLAGDPQQYQPGQAITRGQYVAALVRAIKLPIVQTAAKARGGNAAPAAPVFPDVPPERPEYPYIMAAYNSRLAIGRDNGSFSADS
ncbi:MAG: S-layer homology domain-containing protein, partial [Defluviitaleaceae bacterium]|nr:S-layer homology domain-containing protein [Defluviitaleaceae bacterium]